MADNGDGIRKQASAYDSLTRSQLIAVLRKRDAERRLGLVWERNEIDRDRAIDSNFVVADLIEEQCEGPAPWENVIIEGDNYDALRWLRMTYRGQVKCIYIDPPYNTGKKDWVYNDDYLDPNHRYRHSQWLEFLYQRLLIARDLLTPDGVLLCSINDENRARLELMLDEALPGMRLGSFTWRSRIGGNDTKGAFLSQNHEHVLVCGASGFRFGGTEKLFEKYKYWDEEREDWFRLSDITQPKSILERPNAFYALHDPETDIYYPVNPQRAWPSPTPKGSRYKAEEFWPNDRMPVWPLPPELRSKLHDRDQISTWIKQGRIVFPSDQRVHTWRTRAELNRAIADGDVPSTKHAPKLTPDTPHLDFWVGKKVGFGTPDWKRYKSELKNATQPISSWIVPNSESETVPRWNSDTSDHLVSGMTSDGTDEIQAIFGSKAFNYPKPVSVIRELVRQSTTPGDFVLDFFAGSATTAQAVMELNAENGSNLRFIMVSSTEATKDEPDKNICRDVTAERVRRLNANTDKYEELGAGFAYLRCREVNPLELDDALTPETAWSILAAHHDLPQTAWPTGDSFAVHEGEEVVLVLIEYWSEAAAKKLQNVLELRRPIFLYSFTPGQITGIVSNANVEVRSIRETLQRLFAA